MPDPIVPFTMVGIIVIVALAISTFIRKLGQNEVIGFILAGFLLGPCCLGLLNPEEPLIQVFSELGLFVLLFYLGIELSWKEFLSAGSAVFGLAIIDLLLIMGLGIGALLALGYSPFFAIAVGAMLTNTSTAIVAKFVIDKNIMHLNGAKVALSINVLQDFLGIMILVLLTSVSKAHSGGIIALLSTAFTALVFAVGVFYAVHYFSRIVERWVKQQGFGQIKMALYAIGVGIIVAALGDYIGLSSSLGAYFAGFALSETSSGKRIKRDIVFLMDFFLVFFFVAFGTTIFYDPALKKVVLPTFNDFISIVLVAILLSLITLLGHSFSTRIFGALFGLSAEDATLSAILLFPLGEFLIVIATVVAGMLTVVEAKTVNALAFLLILITLLMFQPAYNLQHLHQKLFSAIPRLPKPKEKTVLKTNTPYTIKLAKSMAFNLFIVLCLAWLTVLLYYDLPRFNVPIIYSRQITSFLIFAFFASVPFFKAVTAFRKIVRHTMHAPF